MRKLESADDVLVIRPSREDLDKAAEYAAITLPWTFNRMMANTSARGQITRGLNIAKGVAGQEALKRLLAGMGLPVDSQEKSHRDSDLFDIKVRLNGREALLDFKTMHCYTDYNIPGRQPLSTNLIADHAGYAGGEWRKFFPMLIPHTQIGQNKEIYCFGFSKSFDFRRDPLSQRQRHKLVAYPYDQLLAFTSAAALIRAREAAGKGFYVGLRYRVTDLHAKAIGLQINGEWNGALSDVCVDLEPNGTEIKVGPFSCLSSIELEDVESYRNLQGAVEVRITRNDLTAAVYNSARRNINAQPGATYDFRRPDFCNLYLPDDFEILVCGWTTKTQFLRDCKKYSGWVWPLDHEDPASNQPWAQITENDRATIKRAGFESQIERNPTLLRAGWMKTHGRGGGACCYVFPNIGANGGVKETNLYVLPQDLHPIAELRRAPK